MIKLNLVIANKWKDIKATASQAGKQGALHPQPNSLTQQKLKKSPEWNGWLKSEF